MPIFKISNKKFIPIKEVSLGLEKNLQEITEKNLSAVFGFEFISSEFALHGFRIDTLAFDKETKSFVIIEYKKDKSISVIDQGYSYLALMLNNKADFILEYNEKSDKNLKKGDVDWSQSKIIFVANSFTHYQRNAISFKDLPIELYEVKKYDNDTILYNQLKPLEAKDSIKTVSKSETVESVSREIKLYTIEDHFKKDWSTSRKLYEELSEKILEIDDRIEEKINKYYFGYKIGFFNICAIHAYKSKIELELVRVDKKDLKDPEKKINKIPWEKRGWGKMCGYTITSHDDIPYAIFLIKQVNDKFNK